MYLAAFESDIPFKFSVNSGNQHNIAVAYRFTDDRLPNGLSGDHLIFSSFEYIFGFYATVWVVPFDTNFTARTMAHTSSHMIASPTSWVVPRPNFHFARIDGAAHAVHTFNPSLYTTA